MVLKRKVSIEKKKKKERDRSNRGRKHLKSYCCRVLYIVCINRVMETTDFLKFFT